MASFFRQRYVPGFARNGPAVLAVKDFFVLHDECVTGDSASVAMEWCGN